MRPLVTSATTYDKCDHLWQAWPLVTSATTCDKCDHLWQVWLHVTTLTTCDKCDKPWQMWQVWPFDKCYRMWQVWQIVNIFRRILQFKLCFSWFVTHHKIHALLIIIDIIWKLLSFPYKKCTFFLFWYITSNYESYIGLNNTGWPRSAGTWVVLGQTQPNPGPRTSELPCRCKFSSMIDL